MGLGGSLCAGKSCLMDTGLGNTYQLPVFASHWGGLFVTRSAALLRLYRSDGCAVIES